MAASFSRWPPSGARDNDIPHKLVSIQPILVIFVSNGMFLVTLNSFMPL